MIFDHWLPKDKQDDQAAGLRQRRRVDDAHGPPSQVRVVPWPRVVMISELPGSDVGARFAFHLAAMLGSLSFAERKETLLIDLAPAASRLPQVLADHVPVPAYQSLWSSLSAGKALATCQLNQRWHLSVAAEPSPVPCALDQLPRVYEQLMRMLSRQVDRYSWIVMLGLDTVVPLDRACWQAADDVILAGSSELSGCRRQAALLQSRIDEGQPERTIWTLPKRAGGWIRSWHPLWFSSRRDASLQTQWLDAGVASKSLPAVGWPERCQQSDLRTGSWTDGALARCAQRVAQRLRLAAACQDSEAMVNSAAPQKKIQLSLGSRPINHLPEEFRA